MSGSESTFRGCCPKKAPSGLNPKHEEKGKGNEIYEASLQCEEASFIFARLKGALDWKHP